MPSKNELKRINIEQETFLTHSDHSEATRRENRLVLVTFAPYLLLLLCALLLLPTHKASASADRLQFYYHIAEGNYLIGDTGGAERAIEQILRLDPSNAPALALRARILLDEGTSHEALEAIETAVESVPDRLEYQILRALILGNLNRTGEAMSQLEIVIESAAPKSKDLAVAQQMRGLMKMAEGNWDEAAAAFKSTYEADPELSPSSRKLAQEAYLEKARAAISKSDVDQALSAINQASRLYDNLGGSENLAERDRLQLLKAKTLARGLRTDEAIRELRQLLGRNQENLEATVTLASLYAMTEAWSSLEGLIEPIAQQVALRDVALYLEGRVALSRNRVGTARAKFEEALELQKKRPSGLRPELLFYSAVCLDRLGRTEKASRLFEESVQTGFKATTHRDALLLSHALRGTEKEKEALALLEYSLLRHPLDEESATAWAYLGHLHNKAGTNTLAISAYNQSLEINPNQSTARAIRGSLLRKIGDLEGAVADFEIALQDEPESTALLYALALTYLQQGKIIEAERRLRLSTQLIPNQPGQQLLHALLAFTIGARKTAQDSLDRYQSLLPENENPAAQYLLALLQPDRPSTFVDPVTRYFDGIADRKEVLDWAGRAESPEIARGQICSAAFWLAQFEDSQGNSVAAQDLLDLAVEFGSPENPEWQFANWQLEHAYRGN